MLWTTAMMLLVLWALGMVGSYAAGGSVPLLVVIAAIVVMLQFFGDRRSVGGRRDGAREHERDPGTRGSGTSRGTRVAIGKRR
jgi:hypothetical protein